MNAVVQPTTIQAWVAWAEQEFNAANLFFGHGTDNAIDEAVFLISHALGTDYALSGYQPDTILTEDENKRVAELLQLRIKTKKPAAYLVNEAWFCGLSFYVDERVLVPRSPIAELIEDEFQPWIARNNIHSILEIGTGSGCIALSCAYYLEDTMVTATDIDDGALEVAEKNLQRLDLQNRVLLVKSDVFDNLADKRYDIIISNPPYVGESEYEGLPDEYKQEPALGLTAGSDGLDCVRKILADAARHLNPHGILIVEVGNSQPALEKAFPHIPFMWLEFERGGEGVFLLECEQLLNI